MTLVSVISDQLTMLVTTRRGKFSPGEAGAGARLDKEARRIVPVPVTGNNLANSARPGSVSLYDVGKLTRMISFKYSLFNYLS